MRFTFECEGAAQAGVRGREPVPLLRVARPGPVAEARGQADRRDRTAGQPGQRPHASPGRARRRAGPGHGSRRRPPPPPTAAPPRAARPGPTSTRPRTRSAAGSGGRPRTPARRPRPPPGSARRSAGGSAARWPPRHPTGPRPPAAPPPAPPGPGRPAAWRAPGWAGRPDPGLVGGLEQVVGHLQRAGEQGDARPQEGVPAASGLAHDRRRPVALAGAQGVPRPGLGLGRRGAAASGRAAHWPRGA